MKYIRKLIYYYKVIRLQWMIIDAMAAVERYVDALEQDRTKGSNTEVNK